MCDYISCCILWGPKMLISKRSLIISQVMEVKSRINQIWMNEWLIDYILLSKCLILNLFHQYNIYQNIENNIYQISKYQISKYQMYSSHFLIISLITIEEKYFVKFKNFRFIHLFFCMFQSCLRFLICCFFSAILEYCSDSFFLIISLYFFIRLC